MQDKVIESNKWKDKEYCKAYQRVYRDNNKIMIHDKRLKRLYGICYEDYSKMFDSQNGACAICLEVKELAVDHCHDTNKVRGLLCFSCNCGIGNLKDSVLIIDSAKRYLTKIID